MKLKNLPRYAILIGVILVITTVSKNIKSAFESNDDYELIKKYLLNDSLSMATIDQSCGYILNMKLILDNGRVFNLETLLI